MPTDRNTSGTAARVRRAAVRLFAEKGFHGTGIRDLAEVAGLSSASLYHYMGTKEELLIAIMRDSLQRLLTAGRKVVDDSDDPAVQLGGLVRLHVITHALHPRETAVVDDEMRALSPARRTDIIRLRDAYEDLWRTVIGAGCDSGLFGVTDPGVARLALLEMCSGVARWYSPRGHLSLNQLARLHTEMAFGLLGLTIPPDTVDMPDFAYYDDLVAQVWRVNLARAASPLPQTASSTPTPTPKG